MIWTGSTGISSVPIGFPLDKASLQVISSITAPHFPMAGSGYPIEQECSHSLLPPVVTPASDLLQHHLKPTTEESNNHRNESGTAAHYADTDTLESSLTLLQVVAL